MVQMTVKYEGALRCKVSHDPSGQSFTTDAPVDNNGKGEAASPTDLCAAALGSCMATIIGMQMEKMGHDVAGTRIEVTKEMSKYKPRRIIKLSTEIWLPAKFDDKTKRTIITAAKGCPVHHSLSSEIDKPVIFHWL
ncbi:OsmC family protein [Coraliomargarita sp. SDUM461004]|uniref:OsmC family protein n=1 Tax=Thalassobacterium sedimentorum TaxID=3041258 RepID=A0ABU1AMK8_9BACT|nr:OsmC family protein [Coraliomargarita sp. SDUM461004]MDQ8196040.1 OsmC family protein [Coraliomargarita sp. SDUM461004]